MAQAPSERKWERMWAHERGHVVWIECACGCIAWLRVHVRVCLRGRGRSTFSRELWLSRFVQCEHSSPLHVDV
eukprot:13508976-Alexandrium_andersonii.AAC.1